MAGRSITRGFFGFGENKARLWLGDGDCVRHRSEFKDHVWSYDFVHERTKDKRSFRILTVIDEFTRESLSTVVRRRFTSLGVILKFCQSYLLHEGCLSISVQIMVRSLHQERFDNG
jgi:hypothetical protein